MEEEKKDNKKAWIMPNEWYCYYAIFLSSLILHSDSV